MLHSVSNIFGVQAKLLEMEALLLKNDPESGPGNSAASAPQPPAR